MQEIVLILSSLAGVATAAAVRRVPRDKKQMLRLDANSHIKTQINSLKIEKDILTKTISRLYQTDSEYSKTQKDKLLLKYQDQLGTILAKLEKLEQASKYPDLGPVGDGLITLMDQKLAKLDDRLDKLSKIEIPKPKEPEIKREKIRESESKDKKLKSVDESIRIEKQKESKPIIIPSTKPRQSFELSTLTNISRKEPKFPLFETEESKDKIVKPMPEPRKMQNKVKPKQEVVQEIIKPKVEDKIEIIQSVTVEPKLETKTDLNKEVAKITEHKALPEPKSTSLEEFDDDGDDLDKIKGDIMKVLSKLDQAEVE